jgi:hypothetical protein
MGRRFSMLAAVAAAIWVGTSAGVARAAPPVNVFAGAGVFVDNPLNFPGPWALASELQAAHFSWVALHVDDAPTFEWNDAMWVDTFRAAGLEVGVWGAEGPSIVTDAAVADLAIRSLGADFYIANAERLFERTKGGQWSRSAAFVRAFRGLQPTLPAALATYGAAKAPWVLPIDYAAWRRGGFELLPEAYYNQYRGYRPDLTVAHALRAGWSIEQVHPVIGVYHHYPASNYVPLLQQAGTRGFSVFLADQATAGDFAALAGLAAATVAG